MTILRVFVCDRQFLENNIHKISTNQNLYKFVFTNLYRRKSFVLSRATGWRRLIGCLKLQVIFRTRATNYWALLWNMTFKDTASYESGHPRSIMLSPSLSLCVFLYFSLPFPLSHPLSRLLFHPLSRTLSLALFSFSLSLSLPLSLSLFVLSLSLSLSFYLSLPLSLSISLSLSVAFCLPLSFSLSLTGTRTLFSLYLSPSLSISLSPPPSPPPPPPPSYPPSPRRLTVWNTQVPHSAAKTCEGGGG